MIDLVDLAVPLLTSDNASTSAGYNSTVASELSLDPVVIRPKDFELRQDLMNYRYWKYMGGPKVMKKDALPRFFDCQNVTPESQMVDPLRTTNDDGTNIFVCGSVNEEVDEFILPDNVEPFEKKRASLDSRNCPQRKNRRTQTKKLEMISKSTQLVPETRDIATCTSPIIPEICKKCCPLREEEEILIKTEKITMDVSNFNENPQDFEIILDPCNGRITQNERSKEIPGSLETTSMDIFEHDIKIDHSEIILDPCNGQIIRNVRKDIFHEEKIDETTKQIDELKNTIYEKTTRLLIEDNPLLFLGLPNVYLSLIDELSEDSGFSKRLIHLVLMKIRQNMTNAVLSSLFGITEIPTFPLMAQHLTIIANFFSRWIIWPTSNEIRLNLPLQFSERYGRIHSIIDIFDVQIGDRNNLTKRIDGDNIKKYLISVTPDGMINYLSSGYNGTMTELQIIENSDYLNRLPNGVAVLADKSYKVMEIRMQRKKCTLIRPPIVLVDLKSTEREKSTIQINCVRDYVQKIVGQLRKFKVLVSHVCLEDDLFNHLDQAVTIAGGLFNLQKRSNS